MGNTTSQDQKIKEYYKCRVDGCKGERIIGDDGQIKSFYCYDHACLTKCLTDVKDKDIYNVCYKLRLKCKSHKCIIKECKNQRNYNNDKYCIDHKCKYNDGCKNLIFLGGEYCKDHICNNKIYSNFYFGQYLRNCQNGKDKNKDVCDECYDIISTTYYSKYSE